MENGWELPSLLRREYRAQSAKRPWSFSSKYYSIRKLSGKALVIAVLTVILLVAPVAATQPATVNVGAEVGVNPPAGNGIRAAQGPFVNVLGTLKYTVSLDPNPPGNLGPGILVGSGPDTVFADATLGFPGWTWSTALDGFGGSFNLIGYDASASTPAADLAGSSFEVGYNPTFPLLPCGQGPPLPPAAPYPNCLTPPYLRVRWISFVSASYTPSVAGRPNAPCALAANHCAGGQWRFDDYDVCWDTVNKVNYGGAACAVGNSDTDGTPFYCTLAEQGAGQMCAQTVDASGALIYYRFTDKPAAPYTLVPVTVHFKTYLAGWDGGMGVKVYEGFSWGYTITSQAQVPAQPPPGGAAQYTYGGVGRDKFDTEPQPSGATIVTVYNNTVIGGSVGGSAVPINSLALLAPYIGPAAVVAAAMIVTAVYLKRVRGTKTQHI